MKEEKQGIKFYTTYGNTCIYRKGAKTAYDLDMGERIPLELVDFECPIKNKKESNDDKN